MSIAGVDEIAAAKLYLRVEGDLEDEMIGGLIDTAAQYVELHTGIVTVPQSRDFYFDAFRPALDLPVRPVRDVTAVSYVDPLTGSNIAIGAGGWRARLVDDRTLVYPAFGGAWPISLGVAGGVMVTADVGYAFPEDVPPLVTLAVRKLVATWFENRDPINIGNPTTVLPYGVESLLRGFRRTLL